jgi:hypothetical protein
MKKTIIIAIISIVGLLTGICCEFVQYEECELCDVEVGEMHDYNFENDIEITPPFPQTIMKFVRQNIKLELSPKKWYLPEEIWERKKGDCVEYVGLWMYLVEEMTEFDTWMIIVKNTDGTFHALGHLSNLYYDIQSERFYKINELPKYWTIKYKISYPEYIWMTYHYRKNVGKYY